MSRHETWQKLKGKYREMDITDFPISWNSKGSSADAMQAKYDELQAIQDAEREAENHLSTMNKLIK
jgi:hypothetical protein